MFNLIAAILSWFYSIWPSYGVAIILLTLTVMVIVTPLTLKGTRSMLQMQRLQPELKRIQNQHRDDRAKMNEELMAFYQANGINPLGGCLPLLVQLPVFLVLFRVVRGLTRRVTDIGGQIGWTTGRLPRRGPLDETGLEGNELVFEPEYLDQSGDLYQRLHESTEMVSWGIDLSQSAAQVVTRDFVEALPYLFMLVLTLVTSLYQQRQIQGRNTGAQINPQQQAIMRVLPFFLPVFAYTMPAALVVYFIVSNLYRIGQQAYITHSLYAKDDSPGALLAKERSGGSTDGDTAAAESKKGRPTPKQRDARVGGGRSTTKTKKSGGRPAKGGGAGRTGKAPTRHRPSGGRTTAPGSRQHRKKKRK